MILHFLLLFSVFCFQDDTRFMVAVPALYKAQNLIMVIVKVVLIRPGRHHALKLVNPGLHLSTPLVSLHFDPASCLQLETYAEELVQTPRFCLYRRIKTQAETLANFLKVRQDSNPLEPCLLSKTQISSSSLGQLLWHVSCQLLSELIPALC